MAEIEKDRPFYRNSNGGVTFSGGEPLLQKEFIKEILQECKNREINTAVDTAGNIPWQVFEEIKPFVDLFLFDMKAFNEEKHRELTGVGNKRILENLTKLASSDIEIWIRIPIIPEVNTKA